MRTVVILCACVAFAGCSKTAPPSAGNVASAAAAVTSASDGGGVDAGIGGGCGGQRIVAADVQPLLSGQITSVKPAPSDPDSCVFATAGFSSITITVRPSGGKETLESWHKGPVTPVPGVGDDAVWEPDLKEIVASHGDTLCTVTAMGPEVTPATAETEGAVCSEVFAGL